jgi:hypothetical protein
VVVSVGDQRKRPHSSLNVAFIYAGNDLRSHTLGACSTIGPAGLNFRVRDGNGWIPRGKITDFASSFQLLALAFSFAVLKHNLVLIPQHLGAAKFRKIRNDLSQLNRLDVQDACLSFESLRRNSHQLLLLSHSGSNDLLNIG